MTDTGHDLDCLFRPRGVAVIGASNDPTKIGGIPLAYLKQHKYAGGIYPINPNYPVVQDLPAYPTLAAVGKPIDMAIVAVPARQVPAVLEDAIAAGVRSLVVFSSGYAEVDEAGREAQMALRARAREAGIRVLGPNCLGFMSVREHLYATFSPALQTGEPVAGNIAIVSQSGAFGAYAFQLARRRGLGMSYWATTGNEGDIEAADCIAWLARDAGTRVILCYLEGARDGPKLRAAFALARRAGKRLVMIKVGRTASGSAAAASHTAALAGEDRVYDALFRQYGVARALTIDEFFGVGYAASIATMPSPARLGIMTVSGGVGALMADDAASLGLALPELPAAAQAALRARVPFCGPRNPVDITGQYQNDRGLLDQALELMATSGLYDAVAVFLAGAGLSPTFGPIAVKALVEARRKFPSTTLAVISMMGDATRHELERAGCLVFEDPSMAVRSLAALRAFAGHAQAGAGEAPAGASGLPGFAGPAGGAGSVGSAGGAEGAGGATPSGAAPLGTGALSEYDALQRLRAAGVPVVDARLAADEDAAAAAARAIGFPVVLKIVSPDIAHKTEAGGVRLGLADEAAVRAAFREVMANARRYAPQARLDGALVAPMVRGGVEMILGASRDPVFGPVVLVGTGGVFAEVLRDTAVRVAPVDAREARAMVDELRGRALLAGARGAAPADVDALVGAIVAVSSFAVAHADTLDSLDVNPFVVLPQGRGALALDALIVPSPAA